jgi:hypothetical protein
MTGSTKGRKEERNTVYNDIGKKERQEVKMKGKQTSETQSMICNTDNHGDE